MVVEEVNIIDIALLESKRYAPISAHRDRPLPSQVALKWVEI